MFIWGFLKKIKLCSFNLKKCTHINVMWDMERERVREIYVYKRYILPKNAKSLITWILGASVFPVPGISCRTTYIFSKGKENCIMQYPNFISFNTYCLEDESQSWWPWQQIRISFLSNQLNVEGRTNWLRCWYEWLKLLFTHSEKIP